VVDLLNTSLSGLMAFQRALATTSNNVANAATPGYSRQQAVFGSRPPQFFGGGYLGSGVDVAEIRRIYDGFLATEVRNGTSAEARLDTFSDLAGRVGDLIGSDSGGLSAGLQAFFDSLQALANDPASIPVRQTLLGEADALTGRIGQLDAQLAELGEEVARRVGAAVDNVNRLAGEIADLNARIVSSPGAADGVYPNELLDRRESLLRELSAEIDVSAVPADDGALNVFVGNGQTLVLGQDATRLEAGQGLFGPDSLAVSIQGADITAQLGGGRVGGLLDVKREVIDPVRNDVGRTAVILADRFNALHRGGFDLDGDFGSDFFSVGGPRVTPASSNGGSGSLTVSVADATALTGNDYELRFDGTGYELLDVVSGEPVPMSGSGTSADPFVAEGLELVVGGTTTSGDRFRISPTAGAAAGFDRLVENPEDVAAAAPLRASAGLGNFGDAGISEPEVIDPANPILLSGYTINFVDATTFQINGAGSFPYTSGDAIDVNGSRVRISGAPAAGDTFTVEANAGGTGDNRNATALLGLRDAELVDAGQRTLMEQADARLAQVGGATAAAEAGLASEQALLRESEQALQSRSGVNLEEEAANLVRYQQAYEANARVVQAANTTFQALLAAVR
jgi:flagellar hook-associated protein 1 FlgK